MQTNTYGNYHPEIATSAPKSPEPLGVFKAICYDNLAVGEDDFGLKEVVQRQTVSRRQRTIAPPRFIPTIPTAQTVHVTAASSCGAAALIKSIAVAPPPTLATLAWWSTSTPLIPERSTTRPSWRRALPAQSCPPPRTDSGRLCARAVRTAA